MNRLFIVLLQLVILPFTARSWDLAVAVQNRIEFLHLSNEGNLTHTESVPLHENVFSMALAYDPQHDILFFSDTQNGKQSSIFTLQLYGEHKQNLLVTEPISPDSKRRFRVMGIAYDYVDNTLYWTNGMQVLHLHPTAKDNKRAVLHQFDNEIPTGIAVDICGRALYWTNANIPSGSIRRSELDGSNPTELITNLHNPTDLTIDQKSQKLYWCDNTEGIYYKIESSNLDGSSRTVLVLSIYQDPISIAARPGNVYWIDATHKAVSSVPSNSENLTEVSVVHYYKFAAARGIISSENSILFEECSLGRSPMKTERYESEVGTTELVQTDIVRQLSKSGVESMVNATEGECLNGGVLIDASLRKGKCKCLREYSGMHCELPLCFNYCIHGTCHVDMAGYQHCRCLPGYHGQRCEHDVCANFCLNGGRCSLGDQGDPVCRCEGDYQGRHCEFKCSLYCQQGQQMFVPVDGVAPICSCENGGYELSAENTSVSHLLVASREDGRMNCNSGDFSNPIVIALAPVCGVLLIVSLLLARKVCILRKRPRIKKRIIVSKNVTPLTSRPPPPGDQCEITIENCCNMNICETPCYEPQLRTSKTMSKTEEKKNLLRNMEEGSNCSPCQENLY